MTCTFQSRGPYQLPHLVLQGLQDFEPARQNVHPQSTIISPGQYLIFNIPARGRNNAKVLLISLHWSITSRHHHVCISVPCFSGILAFDSKALRRVSCFSSLFIACLGSASVVDVVCGSIWFLDHFSGGRITSGYVSNVLAEVSSVFYIARISFHCEV